MLEKLLSKRHMYHAYRQVISNNGAPGVDHMPLSQLMFYLTRNWDETGDLQFDVNSRMRTMEMAF